MSSEPRQGRDAPLGRDGVIEALCEHYAQDRIGIEEFEDRVDRAHRAATREELQDLLADLPPLHSGPPARRGEHRPASSRHSSGGGVEGSTPTGRSPTRAHPSQVQERQTEFAIFSGRVRKGAWVPARRIGAIGVMGGVELDFREAVLPQGPIHIHAIALLGGVEVIVPPGVRVETDGFAVMGAFEEETETGDLPEEDAPVIRVTGFALMGGVEITSRYPGENSRQARRRRKEEARRRLPGGGG